jgi:Reverse transcriptase (RNA-dependent DNA polymerase)
MIGHLYTADFKAAAALEIDSIERCDTFEWVSKAEQTTAILPLKWIFIYKFDSDGYLLKYKVRICVRGDLQFTDQDIYTATLASRTFRALIAISAAFNLKMRQFDTVNAFVNSQLNEEILYHPLDGFRRLRHCWRLCRALYGLKQSFIL